MKTTTQAMVEEMLLSGKRINKFDLLAVGSSVCLAQRILDIRQTKGWNICSQSIKGKGTLREYWLEPSEIARIKGQKFKAFEQVGIGLPGGHNYG